MIDVYQHGTNNITLKGDHLEDSGHQMSAVILHSKGTSNSVNRWAVFVNFNRQTRYGCVNQDGLSREQIIPTIQAILEERGVEEDLHEPEINRYLDIIWSEFGPGGKYAHDREHGLHV